MCGMGMDYTSCTKLQRTDKTLIYQHIFIYQLIRQFFPPMEKKKQCVSFETLYRKEISCNYSSEQQQIQELRLFYRKSKTPDSIIWILAPLVHRPCLYSVLTITEFPGLKLSSVSIQLSVSTYLAILKTFLVKCSIKFAICFFTFCQSAAEQKKKIGFL